MLVNMTERVNVQDAKTRLSELLARVERGEEFIVARGGNPVAKLSPIGDPPLRELGFVPGGPVRVAFFEDLPDDELTAWDGK
jgi:prevent-host-death family protein